MSDREEAYPLKWPSDWPRTRPQDQKVMRAWKKTATQYREALETELRRLGAPGFVISSNVPLTARGTLHAGMVEPRDVGVAVYFARPRVEDFAWQAILAIPDPIATTEEQIHTAYRRLAQVYHPDRGGDLTMFQTVTAARDAALRWLRRETARPFPYVIACDTFELVKWNLEAIVLTLRAMRQMERCGTSALLERAFKGFEALPAQAGPSATGRAS